MTYDYAIIRDRLGSCFPPIVPAHDNLGHRYQRVDTGKFARSVTTKQGFAAKGYLPRWYAKRTAEYIRENLPRLLAGDMSVFEDSLNAGEVSRDASADIGTTAHGAAERYLKEWIRTGSRPDTVVFFLGENARGEEVAACRSLDKLFDEIEVIPIASEFSVWYEYGKDTYAGSADAALLWLKVRKGREGHAVTDLFGKTHTKHDYVYQKGRVYWCAACGREVDAYLVLADWKTSNNIKENDGYAQQDEAYARAVQRASGLKFDELWVVRLDKGSADYEICKVPNRKEAWKEFLSISRAFDEKERRSTRYLLAPLMDKEVIHI